VVPAAGIESIIYRKLKIFITNRIPAGSFYDWWIVIPMATTLVQLIKSMGDLKDFNIIQSIRWLLGKFFIYSFPVDLTSLPIQI
jgi:hypothetical protein